MIEVVIDGGEIHDSRWIGVREAAAEHEAGQLSMLPPTYVTLCNLARYGTVAAMVATERESPVPEVFPVFSKDGEQVMVMFRGDAGYDSTDGSLPGARHRAVLHGRALGIPLPGCRPGFPAADSRRPALISCQSQPIPCGTSPRECVTG